MASSSSLRRGCELDVVDECDILKCILELTDALAHFAEFAMQLRGVWKEESLHGDLQDGIEIRKRSLAPCLLVAPSVSVGTHRCTIPSHT